MKLGTLYGIGVGPGDPELITLKAAKILSQCRHIFAPASDRAGESLALSIARPHLRPDAEIVSIGFSITTDRSDLSTRWAKVASQVATVLYTGSDVCYLTLGDPLLYSTYVYLLRQLRKQVPDLEVVTVPGVAAYSAAAALSEFAVGEGKGRVTIVPTADDLLIIEQALAADGTVVLMKIGKRFERVLDLLDRTGRSQHAVFVSRAGLPGQRVEPDLNSMSKAEPGAGDLAVILVHGKGETVP
ncbi:MAG: precorrin-2 C(20)-methyltransferase [Thermodesulfobacteriota bacterium]